MISKYELNLKINEITEAAKERGIDLTRDDIRAIFLYEIDKLRMMSLRVFCIIHNFGREKFCREPERYGFVKIGGEWFIPVYNIPQVLAGRVFVDGQWGCPKKEKRPVVQSSLTASPI